MDVSNDSIVYYAIIAYVTLDSSLFSLEYRCCCKMQVVCPISFSMELESRIEDNDKSKALGCSLLPLVQLASLPEDKDKLKS